MYALYPPGSKTQPFALCRKATQRKRKPRMTAIQSIAEVRAQFPTPTQSAGSESQDYCVGGAWLMAHGIKVHFPHAAFLMRHILSLALQDSGEAVSEKIITDNLGEGLQILKYNDDGNFEAAWQALDNLVGVLSAASLCDAAESVVAQKEESYA